ncbi:hypothetical protein C8J56DRAFT_964873 [Mycena floridula]|nr:hypothetical protein C8J56DRAFT_964873 [Mycena floridula]
MTATVSSSRPLRRLALHSTKTCAAQASVYGKCIVTTYTDVRKDICKEEFAKFGQCIREAMKRKG